MAYTPTENMLGIQPIALNSTVQNHPLGTVVRATDPTLGAGEFIYLLGVVNTVVGSLVTYDSSVGTTVLAPNTGNLAQPVAVAMAANVASQYGWYQIGGVAVIKKTGVKVLAGVSIFLSGTAGRVRPSAASGKAILGAKTVNTATVTVTTSTINVVLDRPHLQGQII